MPITNGYVTLAELKSWVSPALTDTGDDTVLEFAINGASRAIDRHTNRFFFKDPSSGTQIRTFTAEWADLLLVDDIATSTGLVIKTDEDSDRTYENTWTTSDYDLEPPNAQTGQTSKPFTQIRVRDDGDFLFPRGVDQGVQITTTWGWPSVPDDIKHACLLLATRLWKRRDAVFGVAGGPDMGELMLPKVDPDVAQLLRPFRRIGVLGA